MVRHRDKVSSALELESSGVGGSTPLMSKKWVSIIFLD